MAMYYLVLMLSVAALVGGRTAIDSRVQLLQISNHIDTDVPTRRSQPFVQLIRGPAASVQHRAGSTLELTCEAIAEPAPSVHWFRNDAPVYKYDKESNEAVPTNPTSVARVTSTLLISRTTEPAHYTCLIVSGPNTARYSTLVYSTEDSTDTSERSKLVPLAPRILVSYRVFVDVMGSDVVLPCRVRGHPRPTVTWRTREGLNANDDPRMKVLRSGDLAISSLRWDDMGEYTCQATNMFGSAEAITFVYAATTKKPLTPAQMKSFE